MFGADSKISLTYISTYLASASYESSSFTIWDVAQGIIIMFSSSLVIFHFESSVLDFQITRVVLMHAGCYKLLDGTVFCSLL